MKHRSNTERKTREYEAIQRKPPPKVAIIVDTSTSWGRRIITGINNYVRKNRPWHIFIEATGQNETFQLPDAWQGDGIIARVSNSSMAQKLQRRKIPVVNISGLELPGPKFPCVCTDLRDSGSVAAEHLLERGFKNFGYFRLARHAQSTSLEASFVESIRCSGHTCSVFKQPANTRKQTDWGTDSRQIAGWLDTLPQPSAVFAETASGGRQLIHACQEFGFSVPDEVAVLSAADDELLCEISNIPMSWVASAAEEIGQNAAMLLDRLMQRKPLPFKLRKIHPLGVVTRQSTNILAVQDETLAKAIRFIRETAGRPIQVQDVMDAVHVSRRVLERRFMEILGRTPAAEIYRSRIERAKNLLLHTDFPVPDVADHAGFGSPEHLVQVFRKQMGQTPLQFRNRVRGH